MTLYILMPDFAWTQERERRKEEWKPRFFNRTADSEVFPTEWPDAECPLWKFNGEYLKLEPRPTKPEGGLALPWCTWLKLTAGIGSQLIDWH